MLLASLPSPPSPMLVELGPFHLRWYGLLLALGVLMAVWIARHEIARRGIDPEIAYPIAVWVVPAGLIGARLYHVITDWARFSGHLERVPEIWQGGLGIPGAIAGGAIGAYIGGRRVGFPARTLLDCIVPGLAAAQAIGRFGNFFNQELFGEPSHLPWAIRIDPANRPAGYEGSTAFHPTFAYEALWDLLVFAVLLYVARRWWRRLPGGAIFTLYLSLYAFGRFWIEGLRIDPSPHVGSLRLNQVVAGVVFVLAGAAFLWLRRRGGPPPLPPEAAGGA